MTHYVCPCLNVHIFCAEDHAPPQQQQSESLQTSALSSQDSFFSLPLCQVTLDKKGIVTSHGCLVDSRIVDQWSVHTCLSCKKDTHAVSAQTEWILVNTAILLSDASQIKSLLLSATYSQLYKMILPPTSHNANSTNIESGSPVKNTQLRTAIQSVRQRAADYLLQEQKQLEQSIRQYTENQYALYTVLQNRVARERQSLVELMTCSFQQRQKSSELGVTPPTRPFDHHYPSPPASPDNSGSNSPVILPVAANRQETEDKNSTKTVVKLANRLPANQRTLKQKPRNVLSTRNGNPVSKDFVESAIFDMDGWESEDVVSSQNSRYEDDADDTTMEDTELPVQQSAAVRHKYASSVPISVPFMTTYNHFNDSLEDPTLGDPDKIAASIQALALSIRDERAMFGDLPRRRMNTGDLVKVRPI